MHWTRHPGPLMKRRQILARLIIISPSLFYSSLSLSIGIRTYCLILLSGVHRSSVLHGGSQGRVWSLDLGRGRILGGSSILWCSDNLDPGLGLAAATNWLTSRAKKDCRQEGNRKMIKFLIQNMFNQSFIQWVMKKYTFFWQHIQYYGENLFNYIDVIRYDASSTFCILRARDVVISEWNNDVKCNILLMFAHFSFVQ